MGLFSSSKHTSPSGHFSADPPSDDERHAAHSAAARRRSSSVPRKSVDSNRKSTYGDQGANTGSLNSAQRKSVDLNTPRKSIDNSRSSPSTGSPALPASPRLNDVNGAANSNRSAVPLSPASPSSSSHNPIGTPIAAAHARSSSLANNTNSPSSSQREGPLATEANAVPVSPTKGVLSSSSSPSSGLTGAASDIRSEHAAPPKQSHHHLTQGLSKDAVLSEADAKRAEHDHQYLEPVVHERRHHHEVEEVERHRVVDRHVHHVQMHVQPLVDERHLEVVHSYREVPVTTVDESHAATPSDKALLARLNAQSASTYTVIPHERLRVDKGETQVTENVINHYHTIVMPVWQRDLHEYYRLSSDFARGLPSHTATSGAPISLSGPTAGREGHKLVPDHDSATYEVEYVNRQPASYSSTGQHYQHGLSGVSATVGGDRHSAKEHYPAGAQGTAVREATGLKGAAGQVHQHHHQEQQQQQGSIPTGRQGDVGGVERGLEKLELGVAK